MRSKIAQALKTEYIKNDLIKSKIKLKELITMLTNKIENLPLGWVKLLSILDQSL